jgi:hypothetical protein
MSSERVELWSCGGGRQSAGIAAFIKEGLLPRPDHVVMVALEWEVRTVWEYVNAYIRPAMESMGIPFTAIPRKKYATKDFWGGTEGETILLPAYTNQSGQNSKLDEFCSGEWKREVVKRWATEQPGWKDRGVNNWVGISKDEANRRGIARVKWFLPTYPLLDTICVRVSSCLAAVERQGWPVPPRSRCRHCPNQADAEWAELTDDEWRLACETDEMMREVDPHAFLHKSMIPLRMVTLNPKDDNGGLLGGCQSGTCY